MKLTFFILFTLFTRMLFGQSANQIANTDSLIYVRKQAVLGQPFPAFTANSLEGTVSNDLLKGKVVLINFWFEGCHPCMAEMKALNELHEKLKGNKDFLFISFTRDNEAAIKRVREKYGISFRVLSTSSQECKRLMIFNNGYPTSMVLDKTGTIKYLHGGFYDLEPEKDPNEIILTIMQSEIQSLL